MIFGVQGFTTLADFIIWINLAGATLSVIVAYWAAKRLPKALHAILIPIGILACIYVVAYVLLLSGVVAFARWSEVMRGVSIMAWFIVWIYPWWKIAMLHKHLETKQADSLNAMAALTKALEERTISLGNSNPGEKLL